MNRKKSTTEKYANKRERNESEEESVDESPDKRFLKYKIEIGHGSHKTFFKGLDTESGVPVSWCELNDRTLNKTERQNFIEEAEMLRKLQHPNIVRFYDYWESNKTKPKRIILVTEYMTSGTLKSYMHRFRKLDKKSRICIIKNFAHQILKGLAYLHERDPPVIHRNLKCDSIFVTGISAQVKIGSLRLSTLKKNLFLNCVVGTPAFMAPEIYSEQYDESIDIYAFGMCLLEMITDEYPYQECINPFEVYKRVTSGIRPDSYNRIDDNDLKELIDICTRQNKSQRPNVTELLKHSWFMENNGLKLEFFKDLENNNKIYCDESRVLIRIRLSDKTKRKNWPDNEAIEFIFDLEKDNPEFVIRELRENLDKINDDDMPYLIQAIKDISLTLKIQEISSEKAEKHVQSTNISISDSKYNQQIEDKFETHKQESNVTIEKPKSYELEIRDITNRNQLNLTLIKNIPNKKTITGVDQLNNFLDTNYESKDNKHNYVGRWLVCDDKNHQHTN